MFIISKITGLALNPLLWILLLMIAAWLTRSPSVKRKTSSLALLAAIFFSNGWIIKNIMAAYQTAPKPMTAGERYEVGILLGGMAGFDEADGTGYFGASSDRFIQAFRLYKLGHIRKIIVTGGQSSPFPKNDLREGDFITATLMEMGIPKQDIFNERDSRNTIENSAFTHRITDSLQVREASVLITSASHMPRALRIFQKEGIKVREFPCNYSVRPSGAQFGWQSFLPTSSALEEWSVLMRELTGTLFLILKGY